MRAITICVEFSDLLAVTLPYNAHHFDEYYVVTSLGDTATVELCRYLRSELGLPIFVMQTNKFYDHGAMFAKYAALEQGLDAMGRHGWLALVDADVMWPEFLGGWEPQPGHLYTPRRHMFTNLALPIPGEKDWPYHPLHPQQVEWAGYTQIFHASDPVLGPPPWHETNWRHAGGGDSFFQAKWPPERKIRPPWNVLHLGVGFVDWCGRTKPFLDGTVHPEASRRLQELHVMIAIRRQQHGPDRFRHERIQ